VVWSERNLAGVDMQETEDSEGRVDEHSVMLDRIRLISKLRRNDIASWNASNEKEEVLDGPIKRAGCLQGGVCTFQQRMLSSA